MLVEICDEILDAILNAVFLRQTTGELDSSGRRVKRLESLRESDGKAVALQAAVARADAQRESGRLAKVPARRPVQPVSARTP
jgi:hypothetical protein